MSEPESLLVFTVLYMVPPSGNHYKKPTHYTGRDGYSHLGFKITKETKAFYDATAIFSRGRTVAPITDSERSKVRYGVRIDVYLPPRAHGDFDNFWKCGLDSLVRAGVIHDDAAVDGEHSKCVVHRDERHDPRTQYTVERLGETA